MKYLKTYENFDNEYKTWLIINKNYDIIKQSNYFHDILIELCEYIPRQNKDTAFNKCQIISNDYYSLWRNQLESEGIITEDDDMPNDEMFFEYDQKKLDNDIYNFLQKETSFKVKTKNYKVYAPYRIIRKDEYDFEFNMKGVGLFETKQLELFDEKTKNESYGKLNEDDQIYDDFNKLFELASSNDIEMIKLFVSKGGDINYGNVLENSLYDTECFKYLLDLGANPENINIGYSNRKQVENNDEIIKALLDNNHYKWLVDNKIYINREIKEDPEYEYIFNSDDLGLL